jgi:hypothetical protein
VQPSSALDTWSFKLDAESEKVGETMNIRRWFILLGLTILVSACARTQLNSNATELASSLNSVIERQIFYNLAQSFKSKAFVPSQVIVSSGGAQTTNVVSPTLTLPLAPQVTQTLAMSLPTSSYSYAAPGLSLGMSNSANQNWSMSAANDTGQLRRLRALYNYSTGQIESEEEFKCEYAVQTLALPLHTNGGNVAFKQRCDDRIVYADPNFVRGHNCVLCDAGASRDLTIDPVINSRLVHGFISNREDATHDLKIGSFGGMDFYVCHNTCVPHKVNSRIVDGKQAWSDFILFIYEALLVSTGGAKEDSYVTAAGGKPAAAFGILSTIPSGGSGKAPPIAPSQFVVPLQ